MAQKGTGLQGNISNDLQPLDQIQQKLKAFKDWIWRDSTAEDQFGMRILRALCRIFFIVTREAKEDRITLRASALTFTVVLSLVPMLALGTAVLKGLGAGDQMRIAAYKFIDQFESAAEPLHLTQGAEQPATDDKPAQAPVKDAESKEPAAEQQSQLDRVRIAEHCRIDVETDGDQEHGDEQRCSDEVEAFHQRSSGGDEPVHTQPGQEGADQPLHPAPQGDDGTDGHQ